MGPKDIVESTFSVVEKYGTWRQLKKDTGAILRLLYLESKRNVNLISCIKTGSKKVPEKKNETEFRELISSIDIQILELIFMAGKSNSKVFDFMKNSSDFEIDEDENNEEETPLNALSFLYIKIWTIKKLVSMSEKDILKKINYRVRLKNILSAYTTLIINLEKVDDIKPLIR